jgi:hypothetical protein
MFMCESCVRELRGGALNRHSISCPPQAQQASHHATHFCTRGVSVSGGACAIRDPSSANMPKKIS